MQLYKPDENQRAFKGTEGWDGFCSIHPIQDRKKGSSILFHFVSTFTDIGQDIAHLEQ